MNILIYIRSAEAFVDFADESEWQNGERCDGGIEDAAEWHANCGDSYLKRQIHGGYALLTVDTAQVSQSELNKITTMFGQHSQSWQYSTRDVVKAVANHPDLQGLPPFRFYPNLLNGLNEPRQGLMATSTEIYLKDLVTYLDELRTGNANLGFEGYLDAAKEGDLDPDVVGGVIQQDFASYQLPGNPDNYLEFCTDYPVADEMACYENYSDNQEQVYSKGRQYAERAQNQLDHQGDYYWGSSPGPNQQKHQDFIDHVDDCVTAYENNFGTCESALGQGPAVVCDLCQPPNGCTSDSIEGMRDELFEPILNSNLDATVEFGPLVDDATHGSMPSVSSQICALSSVSGRFTGSAEKAYVDIVSGNWHFETSSNQNDDSEKMRASALCVDKSEFFDGQGSSWLTEQANVHTLTSSGHDFDTVTTDARFAGALSGISGKFEGGGESARFDYKGTSAGWEWDLFTQQSWIRTWTTVFGLSQPGSGTADLVESSANTIVTHDAPYGEQTVALENVALSDGFCYLTRIDGDFDGAGERVSLSKSPRTNSWLLTVRAGCGKKLGWTATNCTGSDFKKIKARAECYEYDQTY